MVDGAHTPGQLDLTALLPGLDCDVYIANMHKWAFSPTSAAFLWVNPHCKSRSRFHHPIVSHCNGLGFKAEVAMLGTRDYSAILTVPAGITFLESLGGVRAVSARNADLCGRAVAMLAVAWGTEEHIPYKHPASSMGMVGCPPVLGDSIEDGEALRLGLRAQGIVVQKMVPIEGDRLYMRVSCAVYNDWTEIEVLRDAVLDAAAKCSRSSVSGVA